MPRPASVVKIVPYGMMPSGQGWSTSIWCSVQLTAGSWSLNLFSAYVAAQRAFFDTWWTAIKAFNLSSVDYRGVKAYYYAASGGPVALTAQSAIAPVVGTGAAAAHPPYVALVASLRTNSPGRSYRGRSYCPATAVAVGVSDMQVSLGNITTVNNAYLALFNSLNGYTSAPNNVTSQTVSVVSATAGVASKVTSIITDSIMDTQHRREDKFIASNSFTNVVP